MSRFTTHLGLVIVALLPLLGGCSTYRAYDGPARPASEVARLDLPAGQYALDGTVLPEGNVNCIEMLPGWHDLEWTYTYPNRFEEEMAMTFHVGGGGHYRLGERFFPAPHWAGPVGAAVEGIVGTALLPITLMFPIPAAPPVGEHYAWIVDRGTDQLIAGSAPDVPAVHEAITFVPVDGE
ncbi:MAG: hypothetical protein ACYTGR_15185 [Planctomycetota bacterium]|jgi:hypothetical protein